MFDLTLSFDNGPEPEMYLAHVRQLELGMFGPVKEIVEKSDVFGVVLDHEDGDRRWAGAAV